MIKDICISIISALFGGFVTYRYYRKTKKYEKRLEFIPIVKEQISTFYKAVQEVLDYTNDDTECRQNAIKQKKLLLDLINKYEILIDENTIKLIKKFENEYFELASEYVFKIKHNYSMDERLNIAKQIRDEQYKANMDEIKKRLRKLIE